MLINFVKVLSLKLSIVFFAIMSLTFSESYSKDGDLNGKIFYGKATEIINSDVDRMPVVIDEIISFNNGKIYSEILETYSVSDCDYYSVIDGRRAIAFTVIKFNVSSKGHFAGREVTIVFRRCNRVFKISWYNLNLLFRQNRSAILRSGSIETINCKVQKQFELSLDNTDIKFFHFRIVICEFNTI